MTTAAPSSFVHARTAPGPRGLPFLGNLVDVRRDRLGTFLRAAVEHGDVARLEFGVLTGRRIAHLLRHPDHVKHVLVDAPDNFDKQTPGFTRLREVLGEGLLTSEGSFWLRQRRIAQPAFHRQRIASFAGVMVRAGEERVNAWLERARRDEPIDVAEEMMNLALRIVCETLLGVDMVDTSAVSQAVDVLLADVRNGLGSFFSLPRNVPIERNRIFLEAADMLDRQVQRIIDARRKSGAEASDLLSLLMAARDPETGEGMSDRQLRDEVMTMFLAGHETTANALAWTFWLLSLHPGVRRKLSAELASVLEDGRLPTFEDVARLEVTTRVLQESMRLYPPAWIVARRALRDDVIGGYAIPAGSLVFVSPYVTHRHPAFWENPEGFDPDRFAGGALSRLPRFAYFPFGGGPRQCIGMSFAMVEATLLLATLGRRVHLDLLPGQRVVPEPGVTLRPRGEIRMRIVPIEPGSTARNGA
ncbi:cytochrome P450 [Polyangium aurulentum]|uniref:cytochrome P450 n=1 Tax=Polyangium aurulentum TaxID=2567896 RepID=UPI0010ADD98B|nr:cytochrome P450 [Polyangium aurulentum]UQA60726.1 cytochrome P450 [Polyangium aurulentum]